VSNPLVSVLTVTYNHAGFVRDALSSVVDQDYDNLQVVVADDGSTDGTADIVREMAGRHGDRIVPLVDGPHLGLVRNFNRAFRECRGKYIACQAGDDLYLPGKVARQVEWMEQDEQRLLCGHDVEEFDSDTGERLYLHSELIPLAGGVGARGLLRRIPYCGIANMVRADAIPDYGFDERLSYVVDWKLYIDCLANGGTYGYIDGVYARRRRHEGNITNLRSMEDKARRLADVLTMIGLVESAYPHLLPECRRARADQYNDMGGWWLSHGRDPKAARAYFAGAQAAGGGLYPKACLGFLLTLLPGPLCRPVVEWWLGRKMDTKTWLG
jgi:glycosyltransferase involved in cell wall biosynthesis